jgi:hypothetical protein
MEALDEISINMYFKCTNHTTVMNFTLVMRDISSDICLICEDPWKAAYLFCHNT